MDTEGLGLAEGLADSLVDADGLTDDVEGDGEVVGSFLSLVHPDSATPPSAKATLTARTRDGIRIGWDPQGTDKRTAPR